MLISWTHFALADLELLTDLDLLLQYLGHCALWNNFGAIGEAEGRSDIIAKGSGSGREMLRMKSLPTGGICAEDWGPLEWQKSAVMLFNAESGSG